MKDYGRVLPRQQWNGRGRNPRRWWRGLRRWLPLLALFALSWWLAYRPQPVPAPDASSEVVVPPFTVCGGGRAPNCVVDGDTIRIGDRSIRIIGIDAPELHPPRCLEETRLGLAAQARLLELLNQGPIALTSAKPEDRDDYGRELRNLVRKRPDGTVQSIAADMIASGTARASPGGQRVPWC